jgi:3-phytase
MSLGTAARFGAFLSIVATAAAASLLMRPSVTTEPVTDDADDPAIWRHASDPARSLVLGTNKAAAPTGALVSFGLDGKLRQTVAGLDRPNNVDLRQAVRLSGQRMDLAVVTERYRRRLRIFRIDPEGRLQDVSGATDVFVGEAGDQAAPMGIALYHRAVDGALFALVSRKTGPAGSYLHQYNIVPGRAGLLDLKLVRRFGRVSPQGEIEAVCVDDALGWVYVADERHGVRKYAADPGVRDADRELAVFARTGFTGDREGIALVPTGPSTGYILVTDQRPGNSPLFVFRREGEPGHPHDHSRTVTVLDSGSDETDGIDAQAGAFGPRFPHGVLAMMHSRGRAFRLFDLGEVLSRLPPRSANPDPLHTGPR